jgi:hypothetical protein
LTVGGPGDPRITTSGRTDQEQVARPVQLPTLIKVVGVNREDYPSVEAEPDTPISSNGHIDDRVPTKSEQRNERLPDSAAVESHRRPFSIEHLGLNAEAELDPIRSGSVQDQVRLPAEPPVG